MTVHPLPRVVAFEQVGPYMLRVAFDDASEQTIDFLPVLEGELYGPLRDPGVFAQVQLDAEVHTPVWPNAADFDPATLHGWPRLRSEFVARAQTWAATTA